MGGILDDGEAMPAGEGAEGRHVGHVARVVDGADRPRAGAHERGDGVRVEDRPIQAADVGEADRGPRVGRRVGGRDEGHRGHDHLVARPEVQRREGEVQSRGARGGHDRMAYSRRLGEGGLERGGAGAHREPAGADDLSDGERLLVAEARR